MLRIPHPPRPKWKKLAKEFGFHFHTMCGEPYWDESAYYQFSLEQIEKDIEAPTAEIHQMCLDAVDYVLNNESVLRRFAIPETAWDAIRDSWEHQDPSLYARLDFVYDGTSPAKLLENNADTPTSLYESGFWQWLWLEQEVDAGNIANAADQFNSLQEKLVARFKEIAYINQIDQLHFACCKDTQEDRGTVQYLQDCASEAGIQNHFVFIEDIGIADTGVFTDLSDRPIVDCLKLYPWEFMLREEFASSLTNQTLGWIEPMWKTVLSNKALLPVLWKLFPQHPNLLPAYFEDELPKDLAGKWIKKPLLSREGANISLLELPSGQEQILSEGPYGEEGFIYQQFAPVPQFGDNHTLIGSWLVDDQPAGMSIREDKQTVTQDMSRFLPHIILD